MRRAAKYCGAIMLMASWWPGNAQAEPFLNLPTPRAFPITCRWSCLNADGSTYNHRATDYGTPNRTEIYAAANGDVSFVVRHIRTGTNPRGFPYGNYVEIRHPNDYRTIYAHLLSNTITVQRGQRVEAGQLLGLSDNTGMSTGPHLHFEVRDARGRRVNPYGDPPDYTGGCGPNALWLTCPPTPAPPPDGDGDGITAAAGDCDDTNRDVHPGADESCNDRDDDCNGTADDPWRTGLAQDIGNPCTVGLGICTNTGTWTCAPDGRATVCDAIPGVNADERCDGLDNDCNGETDETWHRGLTTDLGEPCSITWGSGACQTTTDGVWVCPPDGWEAAVCDAPEPPGGARDEAPETCNGIDDDCDGEPDEDWRVGLSTDLGNPCTVGTRACANTGTWVCAPDGRATVCSVDPLPPQPESCNYEDDDCDGLVDEDWYTGLATDLESECAINWSTATCTGVTTEGYWECAPDGLTVVCSAQNPERCNWVDDDCNGFIDDTAREYLQYDSENCGECFRRCLPTQRCIRWECVVAP